MHIALAGTYSQLSTLLVDTPLLQKLVIQGCSSLGNFDIIAPNLRYFDARFCSSLTSEFLQGLVHSHTLNTLLLHACHKLDSGWTSSLAGCSKSLHTLDLSYAAVNDLSAVFEYASNLTVLNLGSCRMLPANALQRLLCTNHSRNGPVVVVASMPVTPASMMDSNQDSVEDACTFTTQKPAGGSQLELVSRLSGVADSTSGAEHIKNPSSSNPGYINKPVNAAAVLTGKKVTPGSELSLPNLQSLDLSYCQLPPEAVAILLLNRLALHTLNLSGSEGVNADMWPLLHRAQDTDTRFSNSESEAANTCSSSQASHSTCHPDDGGSNLSSLTLVKCSSLSSLCLGLIPAPGCKLLDTKPRSFYGPVLDLSKAEEEVSLS